jgi:hypothetical protein
MSFIMVVEDNRLILERIKMSVVMYLLCLRRLALVGTCCFVVFSGYIGYVLHVEGNDSK